MHAHVLAAIAVVSLLLFFRFLFCTIVKPGENYRPR